nr:zinc finger BED domain-containing protein RICESLEEPER 1-like [Quercus suber]
MDNINLMFFVAVVLNPRYKLKYVKFWFSEWYGKDKGDAKSSKVRDAFKRLYVKRVGQNGVSSSSGSDENSMESKSELDRYLLESFEDLDVKDFDILMWWKMNSSRYRVLSQIARDVLAILVSTVASKSAFSTMGCVLDGFEIDTKIASVCPMPMEEDPSTVVLDDNE